MYPYLRTALALVVHRPRTGISPGEAMVLRTRCWPWDADPFLELNNGRHLTLFDIGRFALGARLGLFRLLRQRGWGLVVGSSATQYRKRIRLFERFEIVTRLVARDEKWFYFEQITRKGETPCSAAFIRTAVVAGPKGTVPTQEVADALGLPDWYGTMPDWARDLEAADRGRPWPPALTVYGPQGGRLAASEQAQVSSSASQ
ncbi:MAG: acyl-CoA thioesterase [Pseudomonadota bacterium]